MKSNIFLTLMCIMISSCSVGSADFLASQTQYIGHFKILYYNNNDAYRQPQATIRNESSSQCDTQITWDNGSVTNQKFQPNEGRIWNTTAGVEEIKWQCN